MGFELDLSKIRDNPVFDYYRKLLVTYQKYVDQSVPLPRQRWSGFAVLLTLFVLRIILAKGWYIICYALGIYLLNLFLAFLTPKFDPSLEQEQRSESIEEGLQDDQSNLKDEEFRPFIRKLPEFNFWYNSTRATLLSIFLSCWSIFDVPVFWPILLVYFIILFVLTMRKQIQHMVRFHYLPFDLGKTKYGRS